MPALKSMYICQQCEFQTNKWIGRCPNCDAWNSFIEEIVEKKTEKKKALSATPRRLTQLNQQESRLKTNIEEFDLVMGGGIVTGNILVLTGEPGIGKSTLSLQLCEALSNKLQKILYISGEESVEQIALRAKRLKTLPENLELLNETNLETIIATLESEKPNFVIIDSIQVISSNDVPSLSGSINQVRISTERLMEWGKKNQVPMLLIGHVTKDGTLAGPRVFEHLVDTILYFEGDRYQQFRILRCVKNRFGSTDEVGLFEMTETGLKKMKNASENFLSGRKEGAFGSVITATMEGTRPFLVEVQALTNTTAFGYPRRTSSGFDVNRLQLLIAVLQKHAGLNLSNQDVYVNVVGGFQLKEPASDLSICLAIVSAFKKQNLPANLCAIGELGLSGELRNVTHIEKRIKEAEKLGFQKIMIPQGKKMETKNEHTLQVSDINEAIKKVNFSNQTHS
ncbi:DNA repair protein RadA [Candidatus Peregrinibacteria bacterium]|nr:DNA repair protein RadA [Candidatus Peregrinibacteria bacterium]